MILQVADTFSPSRTTTDRSGKTQAFRAKLTVEASSSITNYLSAESDTISVTGSVALPSPDELVIENSTQDAAKDLLHGGFIHSITKNS